VISATLAVVVALVGTLGVPRRYRATTVVAGTWGGQEPARLQPVETTEASRLQDVRRRVLGRAAIEAVLRDSDPYRAAGGGPMTPLGQAERLFAAVTVKALGPAAFAIEYVHTDPVMAANVADRLAARLVADAEEEWARRAAHDPVRIEERLAAARRVVEELRRTLRHLQEEPVGTSESAARRRASELERLTRAYETAERDWDALQEEWRVAETASRVGQTPAVRFEVLEPARVPGRPCFPSRSLFAAIGLAVGLLAGLAAAFVAELRDRTIKEPGDLRETLPQPLLAVLPEVRTRRRRG
jgi:uncharacterized protein involved in exopolysaccharide biosynthesis